MFAALNSFQVGGKPTFVSEVFSTSLYTGNGSTQTITNGINLSDKGGMVWIKGRSGATGHRLTDTTRGVTKSLASETTAAEATESTGLTAFAETGFTIGADADYNTSSATYASWTFREQPKFFDIVTYTGNGTSQNIPHSLNSTPGCIIVKRTDLTGEWYVWHNAFTSSTTSFAYLNRADAATTSSAVWDNTAPTSTQFSVGTTSATNANTGTYVAYLFAHDAGGFGFSGNDNAISCGSTNGSKVTLGYEPQWILYKSSNFSEFWQVVDNQRGMPAASPAQLLKPNTSDAETTTSNNITIASDGFTLGAVAGTVIYIAIKAS